MAKLGSSNISHLGLFKNKIINGNFDIWQRGTSFLSTLGNVYNTDRWKVFRNGTTAFTVYQSTPPTIAESGIKSNVCLAYIVTTADTDIDAANYWVVAHKIEGYNFNALKGKTCTLSFWVRSNLTGTYCVSFLNSDYSYSYVVEYTINASNTWEKKVITIPFGDETSGTWLSTTGIGCNIFFSLNGGSNYQATPNQWNSGGYYCTSNQVNLGSAVDKNWKISQVQLEVGEVATDFESRSFQQELAMCQRYFWKDIVYHYLPRGYNNEGYLNLSFPVTMRVTPTASMTVNADSDHLSVYVDGIYGYVTDDWTGTVSISANATYDAEL